MADNIFLGSKLYICATAQNADLNLAGFEALTWVEIDSVVTFPKVGEEVSNPSQSYVTRGRAVFQKGVYTGAATEIEVGYDYTDAGQDALFTASQSPRKYAFKMEGVDTPNSSTTTNTICYFRAMVNPRMAAGGGAEDFVNHTYPIQITDQSPIWVEPEAI